MTSKLEKLQAQRKALDEAIKAAKGAMRKRALAEHRKALARAIDNAIRGGASLAEIEATLAALRAPQAAQNQAGSVAQTDGASHA